MADCDNCANNDEMCDECTENIYFENYYTPMSAEAKEKREAEERQEILSQIPKEEITLDLDPEFKSALEKVWPFVPIPNIHNFRLYFVFCGENFVLSTDTFRLIKIKTQVPEKLIGKYIILDQDNNKIYARLDENGGNPFCFPDMAERVLSEANGQSFKSRESDLPIKDTGADPSLKQFPDIAEKYNLEYVTLAGEITLNKSLLNGLLSLFPDEEITVTHKGKHDPVKFATDDIEAVILPVRVH